MASVRTWTLFACDYGSNNRGFDGQLFMHIGPEFYVKLHGLDEPIVEVLLTEDSDGPYYGWLATGEDSPSMIWPSEGQFSMCFPYGPKVAEDKGDGKPLRFRIAQTIKQQQNTEQKPSRKL